MNNQLKKENEALKKINKELKEKVDTLNNQLKKDNNINKDLKQKILELEKIIESLGEEKKKKKN